MRILEKNEPLPAPGFMQVVFASAPEAWSARLAGPGRPRQAQAGPGRPRQALAAKHAIKDKTISVSLTQDFTSLCLACAPASEPASEPANEPANEPASKGASVGVSVRACVRASVHVSERACSCFRLLIPLSFFFGNSSHSSSLQGHFFLPLDGPTFPAFSFFTSKCAQALLKYVVPHTRVQRSTLRGRRGS